MGRIKNVSGSDLEVGAERRLVLAGQIIDVPDDEVWGYTQQVGNWDATDKAARDADKQGAEGYAERLAADAAGLVNQFSADAELADPDPTTDADATPADDNEEK